MWAQAANWVADAQDRSAVRPYCEPCGRADLIRSVMAALMEPCVWMALVCRDPPGARGPDAQELRQAIGMLAAAVAAVYASAETAGAEDATSSSEAAGEEGGA